MEATTEILRPEQHQAMIRYVLRSWSGRPGWAYIIYSRIAIRVQSNIVPFWPNGRVVKAIRSARLCTLVPCCYRILELLVIVF